MYTLQAIRTNLADVISEAIDEEINWLEIVKANPKADADLAFACFTLAKKNKVSPIDLSQELVKKIKWNNQIIKEVKADRGYLNFILDSELLINRVLIEIEKHGDDYGRVKQLEQKQVMIEYANLNSHKEFHVGHLRNLTYGMSVWKILDFVGWKTVPVSYINDMGANVAKCLWLLVKNQLEIKGDFDFKKVILDLTFDQVNLIIESVSVDQRTGKYLGEIYAEATKVLSENEEFKNEISLVHSQLENHNPSWNLLWQETRRWSLQELSRYLQDFGIVMERQYLESEFIDQSKEVVEELLEKGIAKKSEGAIIVDFDNYPDESIRGQKLGVMLLRKSDGNLLYATKDIPLARMKYLEYPKLDLNLIVVDTRQSLYFKQLFALLKIMGYDSPMEHLGYEFVTLPDGAMSSRKGNIVTLQDFILQAINLAREEVLKRHDDWSDGKVKHTSWAIAMGGILFTLLKQDPEKVIVFDVKKALSFDGATGPYVQYSVMRLNSILKKSGCRIEGEKVDYKKEVEKSEKDLIFSLMDFPEVCQRASMEYKPSIVAQWALEVASLVNAFYRDVPVLSAESDSREARLRLVTVAKQGLINALTLLGIPIPDEM